MSANKWLSPEEQHRADEAEFINSHSLGQPAQEENKQNNDALLLKACSLGYETAATLLIDMGADINYSETLPGAHIQTSVLMAACRSRSVAIVNKLIQKGANLKAVGTSLNDACARADINMVRVLLEAGIDPDGNSTAETRPPPW